MADNTYSFKCPNCDAGLTFDASKQLFTCDFCLSEFTRVELDALILEHKAESEAGIKEDAAYCAVMNEYACPSCGADDIVADANTVADTCPYCHNPVILVGRLSGEIKPDRVIPFTISRDDALARFAKSAKKRWFLPKNFIGTGDHDRVQGVYYPFWVTDADTDSRLTGEARKVRTWRAGNVIYTETSHYSITRRGDIHFEDLVTCALSDADKKMLEGILPYPSDSLKAFDMPYLSGFLAKKRDIAQESVAGEVKQRMNGYAKTLLSGTVSGYTSVSYDSPAVKVWQSNWEYALMPIWIFTYEHRGHIYNFGMNGYTGRLYGKLPIAKGKLAALFAVVTGAVTAIGSLIYLLT